VFEWLLERRLRELGVRLDRAKSELAVLDEQQLVLSEMEDDARIKALVAESPLASAEHAEARRHADAMTRSRDAIMSEISQLERNYADISGRLQQSHEGEPRHRRGAS
jgi:hypothetical protein